MRLVHLPGTCKNLCEASLHPALACRLTRLKLEHDPVFVLLIVPAVPMPMVAAVHDIFALYDVSVFTPQAGRSFLQIALDVIAARGRRETVITPQVNAAPGPGWAGRGVALGAILSRTWGPAGRYGAHFALPARPFECGPEYGPGVNVINPGRRFNWRNCASGQHGHHQGENSKLSHLVLHARGVRFVRHSIPRSF